MHSIGWRSLLFFPPILVGVLVFGFLAKSQGEPGRAPAREPVIKVRAMTAVARSVVPKAVGHGTVEPGKTWEAVAEVGGKVVFLASEVKKGAILPRDAVLLRIDPTDYELAVAKAEADIRAIEAQASELDAKKTNTEAALKIEQAALALAEKELQRLNNLGGATSRASVDQQQRSLLAQRQAVQSLRNTLALLPSQRNLLGAQQAAAEAQLATARRNVARCEMTLPFAARVTAVNIEQAQYAPQGKILMQADGIERAEITAQIPAAQVAPLLPRDLQLPPPGQEGGFRKVLERMGLSAVARLRDPRLPAQWEARLIGISEAEDPRTRTRGFIVAVDNPYGQIEVGKRPPLIRNMFLEVELRGQPRQGIPIPRAALRDGWVWLADQDQRLARREVNVAFYREDWAVIESGLNEGDTVVLSDFSPAVQGMKLDPVADESLVSDLQP